MVVDDLYKLYCNYKQISFSIRYAGRPTELVSRFLIRQHQECRHSMKNDR